MPLVVPDALKKDLRPRRSVPGSATPANVASVKRLLPRIAKAYAKPQSFHLKRSYAEIFEAGLATNAEPELRPLREAADAVMREPTEDAIRSADIETLAAVEHVIRRADF